MLTIEFVNNDLFTLQFEKKRTTKYYAIPSELGILFECGKQCDSCCSVVSLKVCAIYVNVCTHTESQACPNFGTSHTTAELPNILSVEQNRIQTNCSAALVKSTMCCMKFLFASYCVYKPPREERGQNLILVKLFQENLVYIAALLWKPGRQFRDGYNVVQHEHCIETQFFYTCSKLSN